MSDRDTHLHEPVSGTDVQQSVVTSQCDQIDCESAIHTIATTVAKATGKDPTEIPPLYNAIDVDALADLFGTNPTNPHRLPTGTVNFQYVGCAVTVFADGEVIVRRSEQ
ncbi:HalOD1 output domain-containing protein [Halostella sp. PRR32]|uniref:HalOD1 output domain-containing protein n=1 Tax=Halostella sp. PRR32 TaxID=3098147 RepID=UPI002B1E7623|nr:HalOD1 output domain-containing protein [Halostella sp. PRR32]